LNATSDEEHRRLFLLAEHENRRRKKLTETPRAYSCNDRNSPYGTRETIGSWRFDSGVRIASGVGAETDQFFGLEEVDRRRLSVSFAGDRD